MSQPNMQNALEVLQSRLGESTPPTQWLEMTQDKINAFADVTQDHQWIHVDVERAKTGPFGAPIAHGHLTLSIMGHLPGIEKTRGPALEGQKLAINYGFDRVRFPAPVPVGAKIRASSTLKRAEIKGGMIEVMNEITVEIEGQAKPAVVAESLGRFVF
jgi:acyl dehydratase